MMDHIVIPTASTHQGAAFEDLILSHYARIGYAVREWSTYLHGESGRWWQCDGIVEDRQQRILIEAKFFRDRAATIRDINPARRQEAALDTGCTAIRYLSLNGFAPAMHSWRHSARLKVDYVSWAELRDEVLDGVRGYASALLDEFELTPTAATAGGSAGRLTFAPVPAEPLSRDFPEFLTVPDNLELWLRRLPKLSLYRSQLEEGTFWYDDGEGDVQLVPARASDLSLEEAWEIEDAFSGYAARTYRAVKATAEALLATGSALLVEVQGQLHRMGWRTGPSGVRNSLDVLVQLGLAEKGPEGRRMRYELSALGRAYAGSGPDDALFAHVLRGWAPYRALCRAITEQGVAPHVDDVIAYFRAQYAPYTPYARSLFNPNKTEGLLRLYRVFGWGSRPG